MINYVEKGIGLHERIVNAGYCLTNTNGVWVSSNDSAVQAIINAYTLDECKDDICANIDALAKEKRDGYITDVSPGEMTSWPIKQREAAAYRISGKPIDAPLLTKEAQIRGVTISQICDKVESYAAAMVDLEATISGTAGKHKDAVRNLGSFSAVLSYDFRSGWTV